MKKVLIPKSNFAFNKIYYSTTPFSVLSGVIYTTPSTRIKKIQKRKEKYNLEGKENSINVTFQLGV